MAPHLSQKSQRQSSEIECGLKVMNYYENQHLICQFFLEKILKLNYGNFDQKFENRNKFS